MLRRISLAGLLAAGLTLPVIVSAQTAYPNRPIKFVVPLTQGGSNDYLARLIAERLTQAFGQPVVVENRPGAGGNVGTEYVAKQPADGYTILMSSNAHVISPSFFAKLLYDPIKDFEPITLVGTVPFVLTVNAASPARDARGFVSLARESPKGLTYGSAGIGTPHQLAAEMLKFMTGANVIHVPYKGAASMVPALLAGEIDFTIGAINSLLPHIRAGKLRALAVAGGKRTALLPEVPTIAEAVPLPGYAVEVWLGILAPAGTPRDIVATLNGEIRRILSDEKLVKEKLHPVGIEPLTSTPEEFADVIKVDLARYAKLAKDVNIRPE